ncbi:MAG TPA: AfsR/SARP family transcriptional regulator, partial [Rugosimonospora sp.]|nr:AfsR/SARP family transcriptional regulator [Rugosimonospora sp.]
MATVRVRLLGPIDVVVDGVPRAVSGLRRKALLAALALRAGRMVGAAQLVDIVWGESAPTAVANGLQRQISHLRSVLGARSAVVSRPPGYLLDLPGDATDVQAAEHLIRDGMSAADPEDGVRQLQAAVALWRGSPLAELAELPWFDDPARQLEGLLLRARQALIERHLDLGRAAAVVPELEALARAHPLQEQIAGLLMRALYHSGRQAEALAAYQRLRHTLAEELGIDPGPALRDLEAAILRQDPG